MYTVDDDPLVGCALTSLVDHVEDIVVHSLTVDAAGEPRGLGPSTDEPRLVLVDLFLHRDGFDGVSLVQRLGALDPTLVMAICTVSESPEDAARAWAAGAQAYFTKQRLMRHHGSLGALFWSVARGAVLYHVDPRRHGATGNLLSPREIEVLERKFKGLTSREIADELSISVRTIDSHVANAKSKLGAETARAAIRRAEEMGLLRRSL